MILLRVYFDGCWFAEYLVGCDIATFAITLSEAFWLEQFLGS